MDGDGDMGGASAELQGHRRGAGRAQEFQRRLVAHVCSGLRESRRGQGEVYRAAQTARKKAVHVRVVHQFRSERRSIKRSAEYCACVKRLRPRMSDTAKGRRELEPER